LVVVESKLFLELLWAPRKTALGGRSFFSLTTNAPRVDSVELLRILSGGNESLAATDCFFFGALGSGAEPSKEPTLKELVGCCWSIVQTKMIGNNNKCSYQLLRNNIANSYLVSAQIVCLWILAPPFRPWEET